MYCHVHIVQLVLQSRAGQRDGRCLRVSSVLVFTRNWKLAGGALDHSPTQCLYSTLSLLHLLAGWHNSNVKSGVCSLLRSEMGITGTGQSVRSSVINSVIALNLAGTKLLSCFCGQYFIVESLESRGGEWRVIFHNFIKCLLNISSVSCLHSSTQTRIWIRLSFLSSSVPSSLFCV